ncbi:VanW family protein [Bacillus cereus]|nr:VanW family protein [Bacillus cereus]
MERNKLESIIGKKVQRLTRKKVAFLLADRKQLFTYGEMNVTYSSKQIVDDIFRNQQSTHIWNGISEELEAEIGIRDTRYHLKPVIDEKKIKQFIEKNFKQYNTSPTNASFTSFNNTSQPTLVKSKPGKKIDVNQLQKDIITAIRQDKSEIRVPYLDVQPKIGTEDVQKINTDQVMSEYKTSLDGRNENVRENIAQAAKQLDGLIILPKESFSFNQIVGVTDQKHGYKNAAIIMNNKLVQAAGGGVCQVSSTLYNAVLSANLDIIYRVNHSQRVSYVPMGFDATVADNGPDFKFKNSSTTPIYMRAILENNQFIVRIYGEPLHETVHLYAKNTKQTDSTITVSTYRDIQDNNQNVIKSEQIATSTYHIK